MFEKWLVINVRYGILGATCYRPTPSSAPTNLHTFASLPSPAQSANNGSAATQRA